MRLLKACLSKLDVGRKLDCVAAVMSLCFPLCNEQERNIVLMFVHSSAFQSASEPTVVEELSAASLLIKETANS